MLWWGNSRLTITITIACSIDTQGAAPLPDYQHLRHNHHYVVRRGRRAWHCKSHYHHYNALIAGCCRLLPQYVLPIPRNLRQYQVECPPPTFQTPNALLMHALMPRCKSPIRRAKFEDEHAMANVWSAMLLEAIENQGDFWTVNGVGGE